MEIPMEIITDILLRLPAKSLGQFKTVSKSWLALISEPKFIKDHLNTYKRTHFFCETYNGSICTLPFNQLDDKPKFSPFFPTADLFPQHGSCNGLVLGSAIYADDFESLDSLVVLNPTTKKLVKLSEIGYEMINNQTGYACGFGYDFFTDDYKVVTISSCHKSNYVHVYSLRSNTWRRVSDSPYDHSQLKYVTCVFVNGFLHWIANKGFDDVIVVVAFSFADETLSEVSSPILGKDVDCKLLVVSEKLGIFLGEEVRVMNEYRVRESWAKIGIHGLALCEMNAYGVRDCWVISTDGYGYEVRIVETEIFYEDGKIMLASKDRMWVYDVEGKSFRKTIDTSKDIKDLYIHGTYVESLTSPKFSLPNQNSTSSNEVFV